MTTTNNFNGMPQYLQSLNERQREAVVAKEGPVLILAGAGAGKTKTITHRILHIIKEGAAPESILAITFTNKAAGEMRERVHKLLREDQGLNVPISFEGTPFVSTFHSLGVHIMRESGSALGIPRRFTIFDRNDSKRAVKEAVEYCDFDPKQLEPGKVLNAISRAKGNMQTVHEYEAGAGNDYFPTIVARIWRRYEKILQDEKALDFDDLLLKTALLLRDNKEVREHYQNIWKYIHIDEYQDTNKVQYYIARLLAEKTRNICVVGDIDQSIYSWRGADISNILSFEEDYPEAKTVILEENYRSTQTILDAANEIIKKNKRRREKHLFTRKGKGEKIGLFGAYDEAEEAYFIAGKAKRLIEEGVSPREIAVLYRANFQSRVLEEAFISTNVPYQVLGTRFFERKEVKDILSFIRVALNPECLADLKRVINVPARGIGKVTLLKVLSGQREQLSGVIRKKVDDFFTLLERIAAVAAKERPSETVKFVLVASGLEALLKDGTDEDLERLQNIRELVTLATKYDGMSPEEGIEKLLEDAALASDQDSLQKNEDAIKLMTVHAAKGLEYDYVFIAGLEQDLFPHKRREESGGNHDQEEERRLFYVALTRARKKLYLSFAGIRTIFGMRQVNVPSEFVIEIDESLIEPEERNEGLNPGSPWRKTVYFD